jgi:hypothetical protein
VVDCAHRCVAAGRFRPADPGLMAHHMWLGVHGTVLLDLGGYLVPPYDVSVCFESQLIALMIGAGDDPVSAAKSVTDSLSRFDTGFGDDLGGGLGQAT